MAEKKQKTGLVYKMSKTMAKEILATRRKDEKKYSDQEFLCMYVNDVFRPIHECVQVIVEPK